MQTAMKFTATIQSKGKLTIDSLPLPEGQRVEVVVVPCPMTQLPASVNHGTAPYRYDDPFEPATPAEDWDAAP